MNSDKPWWMSKTNWGGIFSILSGLGLAGINIDFATGDFSGNIYELGFSLSSIYGGVQAIIGRALAKTRVTLS